MRRCRASRASLSIADDERVVLAAGRLSREKGHIDLVAALDHLRHTTPEIKVRLIIVGDGPERQRLERASHSLGVSERVAFAGQVNNIDVYYAMADMLALPSHSEGSPNVLLEAMAAGVPVVATEVGGVPEIVTHDESALLVSQRDPHAMAAAIGRVLTDASWRAGWPETHVLWLSVATRLSCACALYWKSTARLLGIRSSWELKLPERIGLSKGVQGRISRNTDDGERMKRWG